MYVCINNKYAQCTCTALLNVLEMHVHVTVIKKMSRAAINAKPWLTQLRSDRQRLKP